MSECRVLRSSRIAEGIEGALYANEEVAEIEGLANGGYGSRPSDRPLEGWFAHCRDHDKRNGMTGHLMKRGNKYLVRRPR